MATIELKDITPEQLERIKQILEGKISSVKVHLTPAKKETHIGVALDASGSMAGIKNEIIGAYNAAIDSLRADQDKLGTVYVTFVTFGEGGGAVIEKYRRQPLSKLEKLTPRSYQPSGMTPFYDGLGLLLSIMEQQDGVDGVDRAFLVNVFTDGMENASREWATPGKLKEYVEKLQAKGNWTITYAGANVNLAEVAQNVGLIFNNMAGFEATGVGVQNFGGQHVNSMQSYSASRGAGLLSTADFYAGAPVAPPVNPDVQQIMQQLTSLSQIKATDYGSVKIGGSCINSQITTGNNILVSNEDKDEDDDNGLL